VQHDVDDDETHNEPHPGADDERGIDPDEVVCIRTTHGVLDVFDVLNDVLNHANSIGSLKGQGKLGEYFDDKS